MKTRPSWERKAFVGTKKTRFFFKEHEPVLREEFALRKKLVQKKIVTKKTRVFFKRRDPLKTRPSWERKAFAGEEVASEEARD